MPEKESKSRRASNWAVTIDKAQRLKKTFVTKALFGAIKAEVQPSRMRKKDRF